MPPFLFLALATTALALVLRRGLLAPGEVLLIGLFLVLAGSNKRFLFELSLLILRPAGSLLGLGLARLGTRHPGFGRQGWIAGLGLLLPLVLLFPPSLDLACDTGRRLPGDDPALSARGLVGTAPNRRSRRAAQSLERLWLGRLAGLGLARAAARLHRRTHAHGV
ncbi:hypothetical protein [endosymbiont of unidentified scaly snail isolate Monju]|uniref:hypothetical protein n=1 Tax=endosymbiont of unidentified scaly snail isolate Monju TaxID=1248727 RepID=UPI0005BDD97E